jgi:prepilin-type N-terminal cleavage/methylation domain-containing protein
MKLANKMNNERGLTVLELMTTIAIIAIMSATAVPNFTIWRNNYQIKSEVGHVHMDLLSARMTAMKNGNNVVVTFDTTANSYSILNDTNNNGVPDTGESFGSRELDNNVQFGFAGGTIKDMDGNSRSDFVWMGGGKTVAFDSRGQADLSGVLFLIHKNHYAENDNSRLRGISIVQATGVAELWKYNGALTIPWE